MEEVRDEYVGGVPFSSNCKIRDQMLCETSSHGSSEVSEQDGMEKKAGGMLSCVSSKREDRRERVRLSAACRGLL